MKRRKFLKKSLWGGAALSLLSFLNCESGGSSPFPKRRLGRTGEMLSMIGFGGILVKDEDQKSASNLISRAVDLGINYFDVAPSYGNAEEILGPALKPYRKDSFLAGKTMERQKDGAERELQESLKKLHTDYFDLYQLHALTEKEDVDKVFGPKGAMELIIKAKKAGQIRYIGFSAHSELAALMAMEKYDFDSILFPINFVCWHQGDFGPKVVATARRKNMGILALKALALTTVEKGKNPFDKLWYQPVQDKNLANLALRFTLSQGTTAAIPPGDVRFFWQATQIAQRFTPLNDSNNKELKKLSVGIKPLFRSEIT
jgi:predicted aldo/keto reductase-like oxidoreductase